MKFIYKFGGCWNIDHYDDLEPDEVQSDYHRSTWRKAMSREELVYQLIKEINLMNKMIEVIQDETFSGWPGRRIEES